MDDPRSIRFLPALLLLLLALAARAVSAQERELPPPFAWEADLATATRRSTDTGRPVIAYFTFDTCHWCKVLQRETFPDPQVEELGARFHWVYVDRDASPELVRRFNVSSYPGLLVLGHDGENVHRFHGHKEVPVFLGELREGLRRWALYRAGERFDEPAQRTDVLCPGHEQRAVPAPSQSVPAGLCVAQRASEIIELDPDGTVRREATTIPTLFVAQGDRLWSWDGNGAAGGWVEREDLRLPRSTQDLAAQPGSSELFVVGSGWTRGDPILVYDTGTGAVVREIVTAANVGGTRQESRGLCWADGSLWVLTIGGAVHEVDPESGDVARTLDTGLRWTFGLAFDGRHLVCGSRDGLHWIDRASGDVVRHVPTNYHLRAVGHGRLPGSDRERYLVMEQPVFGFDRDHRRVIVHPARAQVYGLDLTVTDAAEHGR